MKLILCIDKNYGIAFNHRRQSRDKVLIEDVLSLTRDSTLFVSNYSAPLFPTDAEIIIDDGYLSLAKGEDYCFLENQTVDTIVTLADEIILYNWNRKYPADTYFDSGALVDFRKKQTSHFIGNSHEKITREVFVRKK